MNYLHKKIDIIDAFLIILLIVFYIFTFYVFLTGHDILKGNFTFFNHSYSKLTHHIFLLTFLTISIPIYFQEKYRNKS